MATAILDRASTEWAKRPSDQRYLSLDDLKTAVTQRKDESWTLTTPVSDLRVKADDGLTVEAFDRASGERRELSPTNWSFGQLAQHARAPAYYLRHIPAELAAINVQWGLEHTPLRDDSLVLGQTNGHQTLRSMTSTSYGRIWDRQVVEAVERANGEGRWQFQRPATRFRTRSEPLLSTPATG